MDCGVASIAMISKYYGKNYSISQLNDFFYLSKDGVSLFSISDVAEKLGFKTLGGRFTFDQLKNKAPLPSILHWEQQHFVVIYKIKKNHIIIGDPEFGIITYKKKEFLNKWISTSSQKEDKGVALLIEPTPNFYNKKLEIKNKFRLSYILKYLVVYRKYFGQLILGLLLGSLLQLIFPFLTQAIVDIGIKNQNISFIYLILLAQLMLFLSKMSVDFIRRWILLHISIRINITMVSDFLIKLMKLPMSFFDTKLLGDILQRMGDYERLERFITGKTLNIVFSLFTFLIFGFILLFYSVKIFIIFLTGSILYTLWIFLFLSKRKILDYKYFEQRAISQSYTYQLIFGMQEIKLQNCEKRKRWEWEEIQADLYKTNIESLKLDQYQEAGNNFINELKNILITIVAATSVINGEMTLGMMLAIQYIIGQLNSPIEQTVSFIQDLQDIKISLERINDIHQKEDENKNKYVKSLNILKKQIDINNLVFQYEGPHSKKVLKNINLVIPHNKVTAIVGASGSGKTTLIKLLLQYYSPVKGNIKINNTDLNDINTVMWRKKCGAVMQDGYIFSESIAHNIAVSDNEIDKEKLIYAAKTANIHNFINDLPLKYNTIIGNEGQNLSQGQRQRVLIARAVYKNPDFLFFDEATNALDANNEKEIVDNLINFYKNKTVIIVAHRLSTVQNADKIVVLNEGEIVEVGNHKELTIKRGFYYNLVKNQLELGSS